MAEEQHELPGVPEAPDASSGEQIEEVMDTVTKKDVTITLSDGQEVTIYRCKLRHLGVITQFIEGMLQSLGVTNLGQVSTTVTVDLQNPQVLLQLISNKSTEAFAAAADLCSLSHEELNDLDMDDGLRVVVEVWDVNRGFFLQTVMPILTKLGVVGSPVSEPKDTQEKDSSTRSARSSKADGRRKRSST